MPGDAQPGEVPLPEVAPWTGRDLQIPAQATQEVWVRQQGRVLACGVVIYMVQPYPPATRRIVKVGVHR